MHQHRCTKGLMIIDRYANRDLSWLSFNERVLAEATDPANPLLERIKFLSITASNLDEFIRVRVALLAEKADAGITKRDAAGMKPKELLHAVTQRIREQTQQLYAVMARQTLPELASAGIRLCTPKALTREQTAFLSDWFDREAAPCLASAIADEQGFPLIPNGTLNLAVLLAGTQGQPNELATIALPDDRPRTVALPGEGIAFVLLEAAAALFIGQLFPQRIVLACCPYRVTRSAVTAYHEGNAAELPLCIAEGIKARRSAAILRVEYPRDAAPALVNELADALQVERSALYPADGPIRPDFFMKRLAVLSGFDPLRFPTYTPSVAPEWQAADLFAVIRRQDRFLYVPYDAFDPVVMLLRQAAQDGQVLAIKQTIYRVSSASPVIAALADAARRGKQVTVLVEIKARFDEENNLRWGRALEEAGCQVMYGLPGLKTHSKITLITRKESDAVRRYVHLGTGNYNDVTARCYTDMGILTADEQLGRDACSFFDRVAGYGETPPLMQLVTAPDSLRLTLLRLIRREAGHALAGRPCGIEAKLNALVDTEVIDALYEAGRAGVPIDLTIRGACCLRAGERGLSENITVRSIVGRFLEHARILRVENGGQSEVYLSSADWMPRNLDRRVELMFPVKDAGIKARVESILRSQQRDIAKAWLLRGDRYAALRCTCAGETLNSQEALIPYSSCGGNASHGAARNGGGRRTQARSPNEKCLNS